VERIKEKTYACRSVAGETGSKILIGRHRLSWKDSIQMDLKDTE
jgi:hypothetical protein